MLADMAALESLEHPSANRQPGVLEPGAGTARSNASAPRWRVNYCLNRRGCFTAETQRRGGSAEIRRGFGAGGLHVFMAGRCPKARLDRNPAERQCQA